MTTPPATTFWRIAGLSYLQVSGIEEEEARVDCTRRGNRIMLSANADEKDIKERARAKRTSGAVSFLRPSLGKK